MTRIMDLKKNTPPTLEPSNIVDCGFCSNGFHRNYTSNQLEGFSRDQNQKSCCWYFWLKAIVVLHRRRWVDLPPLYGFCSWRVLPSGQEMKEITIIIIIISIILLFSVCLFVNKGQLKSMTALKNNTSQITSYIVTIIDRLNLWDCCLSMQILILDQSSHSLRIFVELNLLVELNFPRLREHE